MGTNSKWKAFLRPTLTLELTVVLPAATLILLSVLHLRSIHQDRAVEAAIGRDFRQVLFIAENRMDQRAYELLDPLRLHFPSPGSGSGITLDALLSEYPYAAHAFLYDPQNGLVFRSAPARLDESEFQAESHDLETKVGGLMRLDYAALAKSMAKSREAGMEYAALANWPARGEKREYQPVEMFLQPRAPGSPAAIGGIVFDSGYLKEHFFPEALKSVLASGTPDGTGDKNHPVLLLHPSGDSIPLAVSPGWDNGEPEVERDLETVFPGLTLGIKLRGTTLEALGWHFIMTNFLILGALSVLLGAGIWLTFHNVKREMALARLKSDFVSNVSHDLRTPLSLIRLYAETLEMGRVNDEDRRQEYFRIIHKESERLTGLINNILDFSRIEAGRQEYDFRETDVAALVRETLDSYRFEIEQQGFTLETEIVAGLPRLRVDREAIARSLLNLVQNAMNYSGERKFLRVVLRRAGQSVRLEVLDRGIGIPRSEQRRIFEKFYRVGDPLVHNTKGSGLGLALVRHIVEDHRGEIRVESDPGQGSRFIILLPIPAPAGEAAPA
jgi:signal transduction histidine kinase